jgi:phospholipid/cholesterol/gamma-HCH transport system substrate-binding protein
MKRRDGINPALLGLILLAAAFVALTYAFTSYNPVAKHFEIKAAFKSSNNIKPGSPVRIAGVEVGKVSKVEPLHKGADAAVVTLDMKKSGRPVHKDARAKIRPRIFLEGNFYVELRPGSPSAPELGDGDMIPIQQTAIPVQLDQVLKALEKDTRADLREALAELFRAYSDDAGKSFNASLQFQPDAYRFSTTVNKALLGKDPHDLSDYIRDQGTVAAALDRNPGQLKSLITDFNRFAGALAREQGSLAAAVQELPQTLRAATPALDALNAAFPDVRRLAVGAVPGVRSTGPALEALQPLVVQLRGLVSQPELRGLTADLRASTPPLTRFARQTVPLLGELRQFSSCANTTVIPAGNDQVSDPNFPANGPSYQEFFKVLSGLAGESRSLDANGQFFKVLGTGGVETFTLGSGLLGAAGSPILGTNPPKAPRRPPLRPDVPCETQQQPDLRTIVGRGPARVANNQSSPAAVKRTELAKKVALKEMAAQLKLEGQEVRPVNTDATLDQLRKAAGR